MLLAACEAGDNLGDGNSSNGSNGSGQVHDPDNPLNNKKCSNNEILHVSKSCLPMELSTYDGWGAKLTSNTYENGVGRLTFNGEVTTIPQKAFYENELLEYIKIPNGVTFIGDYAFYCCSSLASITIPDSVTLIRDGAFYNCTSLTSVYCKPTTPPAGGFWMFEYNASGRKIYVPRNSVSAYKSANGWGDYANYIEGYDF